MLNEQFIFNQLNFFRTNVIQAHERKLSQEDIGPI